MNTENKSILKIAVRCISIFTFMVFMFTCIQISFAGEKVFRIRAQTLAPTLEESSMPAFAEKIRVNTGGRVIIQLFPSGSLVPADQMAVAVSEGTIEAAHTFGGYHSGLIDVGNIESGLPMSWSNLEEAIKFYYYYGFEKIAREAYSEKNIFHVAPVMEEPYLMCSKKPVHTIEDLKTMKIRATSSFAGVLNKFGIKTVYLPGEEMYTALATGIVDGIIYGNEWAYAAMKLEEISPYIIDLKMLSPLVANFIINMKVWNSMPEDLRGIVEETSKMHFVVDNFIQRATMAEKVKNLFKHEKLSSDSVSELTKAALTNWDEEAAKSPRNAKAIKMLRALAKESGRL